MDDSLPKDYRHIAYIRPGGPKGFPGIRRLAPVAEAGRGILNAGRGDGDVAP